MTRFSLRSRLRVGLAVLAATLALVALSAIAALDRLGSAVATLLKENYVSVIASEQMKEALERQDSAAIFAATGREDFARALLVEQRQVFSKNFAIEASNVTLPGEGALVEQVRKEYADYVRAVDAVLALPVEARGAAYFKELLPRFTALKQALSSIQRMNQLTMEAADRDAKRLAHRTKQGALVVSAAAILFAVVFALRFPRGLIAPIDELADTARAIGEGKLDVRVPEPTMREIEPLTIAFSRMLEKLRVYRESSLGELLAARDLANATVSCMLDPVVVFGKDGEILLANEAAEKTFGLQPGTAAELASLEIVVPEALASARDQVLSRGEAVLPRTLSEAMRWDRGGERYYLVRAAPLTGSGGVVAIAQEVTRYRRIDELKSDVVATVSHQFKTPLTSLRMATHMLLEPKLGPLNDAQRELVDTAKNDTERLRAMVDELLDLVRIESEAGALHRRAVDAAALLEDAVEAHRTMAREKGVVLEAERPTSPVTLQIDPDRMAIVLANLASNAIRHTPRGGRVSLTVQAMPSSVELSVVDTGEGIAESELGRVFDRAVSLGNDASGRHGLGLAIAREIVLHHGGELRVTSALGRGSTFTIVLPQP